MIGCTPRLDARIRHATRRTRLPHVVRFEWTVDQDSTGELAIFLWVILRDNAPRSAFGGKNLARMSEQLRESYARFVAPSDPGRMVPVFSRLPRTAEQSPLVMRPPGVRGRAETCF